MSSSKKKKKKKPTTTTTTRVNSERDGNELWQIVTDHPDIFGRHVVPKLNDSSAAGHRTGQCRLWISEYLEKVSDTAPVAEGQSPVMYYPKVRPGCMFLLYKEQVKEHLHYSPLGVQQVLAGTAQEWYGDQRESLQVEGARAMRTWLQEVRGLPENSRKAASGHHREQTKEGARCPA